MRIGIVGTGRMGGVFAQALARRDDVDLLVAGSRPGRAAELAAATGAAAVDRPADLMESVDGAVIAAATPAHPELIRLGCDAGIPLFCEKPIALDLATTDALIAATERAGVALQVGFQRRFDPEYLAAREAVASGAVGEVYLVRTASHDRSPSPAAFIGGSGGIERDLLIHDFDIARFVTGRKITAVLSMAGGGGYEALADYDERDDTGVVAGVVRFEGGALGAVTGLRHHPAGHDVRMEVHGSEGSVVVGWDPRSPLRPGVRHPHDSFLERFAAAYGAEMDAFVEMVAGGRPNPCPPGEGRDALVVALAAERSRRRHRVVEVAEIVTG